jgi:uncharacterized protein YbjT (DUF2867 family)
MRVFVTGATGFIGRALIPRLQRDGHAVTAWVRKRSRAPSVAPCTARRCFRCPRWL